jgi:hypothetical protein
LSPADHAETVVPVEEEELAGGVANAGRVTRVGDDVLRPSTPHSASIHRLLRWLQARGFDGVPMPVGVDPDGRERLTFRAGDVAVPPYPSWAQTDRALASIAVLLRRFHDASRSFDLAGTTWSPELADSHHDGPVVCHNDVCLENVVFHDDQAIALLDFDFAAPGDPVHDIMRFALMCVPVDDDVNAARLGWCPADKAQRLRLIADVFGLDLAGRRRLLAALSDTIAGGGAFVRRRVQAGDPGFVKMWHEMGGAERFDRRQRWWAGQEDDFANALRRRT